MLSCNSVKAPAFIDNATGDNLLKDLKGIPDIPTLTSTTDAPTGTNFSLDVADNTNIYKLLLTAAGITNLTVNVTITPNNNGSTTSYTITSDGTTITFSGLINKFTESAIANDAIKTLLRNYGFAPLTDITGQTEATLTSNITKFKNKVNFTYCMYEKLYKKALTNYFDGSTSTDASNKLKSAIMLNLKLAVIISGLDRIRIFFEKEVPVHMATSNNDIATTTSNLSSQLNALTAKDADRDLYKRMVEYTEEKNQAHRNLLGLYSVLNLVALGVLFYIARN